MITRRSVLGIALAVVCAGATAPALASPWTVVGGDPGAQRFSELSEIHRGNVGELEVVWTYRHGDFRSGLGISHYGTAFEATPILVDGRLVFSTPFSRVVALDPGTGKELWTFDPEISRSTLYPNMMISRGVAHWRDASESGTCAGRILLATLDARLIALDVETGRPCKGFGSRGTIDLTAGIEPLVDRADYNVTSPPTIVGDLAIVGSSIADMVRRQQPPGSVRAFDVRTGALVWTFHTIPRRGEPGVETWEQGSWKEGGGANVWSIMTADPVRGLVFLPVSTVGPDFYGGDRPGANLYSDSVVALDAATGAVAWSFQTVHHDLWDYDLAAPPILARVRLETGAIDALAQATKTGLVFVLDRETGAPLFPVEERPVPSSDVAGEKSWPTQPFPSKPPPLVPHRLTEAELWSDHPKLDQCREKLRGLRNEGIFTPPSTGGSLVYPGTAGGANWSGGAYDETSGRLFVPVNDFPMTIRLEELPKSNFDDTDGLVLGAPLRALWWLWRGHGTGLRYHMIRAGLEAGGILCNRPPWGELVAVDLERGEIAWRAPIGETEDGVRGTRNFGPPLATAGGVVFQGGGHDPRMRAHDSATGRVLATFDLPAGLHAGPMTYDWRGRQILVVPAGGHVNLGSPLGDWILAYALPAAIER